MNCYDIFSWLWDLAPDGSNLLLTNGDFQDVRDLDLNSLEETKFLIGDKEVTPFQAHFSHDGRWVTFNATTGGKASHIYVAPFGKALVPQSEWIPVTHGEWDDKPRFSSDERLIFFVSGPAGGLHRLWAQKVQSDMRPDGNPVAIYSPTDRRRVITGDEISVGSHLIAFGQAELAGNIWLIDPAKKDAH